MQVERTMANLYDDATVRTYTLRRYGRRGLMAEGAQVHATNDAEAIAKARALFHEPEYQDDRFEIAEIDGRTTYKSDDQRDSCLARARSALSSIEEGTPPRDEVVEALRKLRFSARLLHQNAVACVEHHHGLTPSETGWLADCLKNIESAESLLSRLTSMEAEQ